MRATASPIRALALALVSTACARAGDPLTRGLEGASCRVDGSCDTGLVCSASRLCVRPSEDCPNGGVCGGECASHHETRCDEGQLYYFDGCGRREELAHDCCGAGCEGVACRAPSPRASTTCDGDAVRWVDECGVATTVKEACCGAGCTEGSCNPPASHVATACVAGSVYWIDACGRREELVETCCAGCAGDQCAAVTSHATTTCSNGDVYWADSCGRLEDAQELCCAGCDDGACVPATSHARFDCDGGDVYWYDSCDVREELKEDCDASGCSGRACVALAACPAEMVAVGTSCVDKFEASIFEWASCAGARFGDGGVDDYPTGFPDRAASAACTGVCNSFAVSDATVELYACSAAGRRPSSRTTWYQAKLACENVGKRLCNASEWVAACRGPSAWTYPYGNVYQGWTCNGTDYGAGGALSTGAVGCGGGYAGLMDLAGNLAEWVAGACSGSSCQVLGGSFQSASGELACASAPLANVTTSSAAYGFRCCRTR